MEIEKIYLEKSWNFSSDLKHCVTNFSVLRAHFKIPHNTYREV